MIDHLIVNQQAVSSLPRSEYNNFKLQSINWLNSINDII